MKIHTATDLGALIRDRRIKMGIDQVALAKRAGTSRKWLGEVEQGKPRAAIGLILRTLQALGVSLEIDDGRSVPRSRSAPPASIDIDQHLEKLRRKP
jgi:HTH-type transcriptional regulator/antitoxin HipB